MIHCTLADVTPRARMALSMSASTPPLGQLAHGAVRAPSSLAHTLLKARMAEVESTSAWTGSGARSALSRAASSALVESKTRPRMAKRANQPPAQRLLHSRTSSSSAAVHGSSRSGQWTAAAA